MQNKVIALLYSVLSAIGEKRRLHGKNSFGVERLLLFLVDILLPWVCPIHFPFLRVNLSLGSLQACHLLDSENKTSFSALPSCPLLKSETPLPPKLPSRDAGIWVFFQ